MAKRQGGELNHENWNQEAEPEEAGQFRQANPGALKGRVIKTARRRKVVGSEEAAASENKSAFSGFGGFTSKSVDAASAFSFIGKPADVEDKPAPPAGGGFVFGSSSTSKPVETSGFSFGKPSFGASTGESSEPIAKKSAPLFGTFGGASEDKETKPMFGTSTSESKTDSTTFGAFSFGSKADEKPSPPTKVEDAPKSDLMAMFKPAPGWSCSMCMVSNPVDKTSCLACETPKPGSKPVEKPAPAFGAAGGFSFGDASKSTSSGFSFGSSVNKSEENKENSVTSGFSFGAKKQSNDNAAAVVGFSFGNKSAESSNDKPATGSFSFGAKPAETKADKSADSGFSFGAKATESTNDKSGSDTFSFGAKSEGQKSVPLGAFAFGGAASKPVKEPEKCVLGGFSQGSTEKAAVSGSFSFGSSKTTTSSSPAAAAASIGLGSEDNSNSNSNSNNSILPTEENSRSGSSREESPTRSAGGPSKEYLAHLKALNMQVAAWINQHLEQNPLVLLSPVFIDYDKHLKEITGKYKPEDAAKKSETKVSSTFSTDSSSTVTPASQSAFGAKSSVTKDTSKSVSPFGTFGSTEKPATSAAPFSFGLSSASTAQSSTPPSFGAFGAPAATGGFTFGLAASSSSTTTATTASATTTAATEEDKNEDEDTPPVVELKQVVEDDAIYSKKCKLFYKKNGSYVEKGVGMLYLKPVDGDKTQLLVRADTNLGNVLLNILLSSQIPTTRVGKNNVMMVCVPNPPVDPKADTSAPCPMLIRVKDGEAADELKAKIDECKEK